MKSIRTTFIAATLLAGLSGLALSQTLAQGPTTNPRAERMDKMHAKMEERHTQRLNELKSQLKLQTSQEGAWNSFVLSMQKPEHKTRSERAGLEKLTTPERLDHMQAMRTQGDAHLQKRIDGTKAFYATLSAEQKQVFDKESARTMGHKGGGKHRMGHNGGHHNMH